MPSSNIGNVKSNVEEVEKKTYAGDKEELYRLGSTEYVFPEDGDIVQSSKCCFK
jgi:hypothetical protein